MNTYRSDAWAVLGDASRRSIVEHLAKGPTTVSDLAAVMAISRPAVSQHLKVLRDAGVVQDEPRGRQRVYCLDVARLERYRRELDRFWAGALERLTDDHEAEERKELG